MYFDVALQIFIMVIFLIVTIDAVRVILIFNASTLSESDRIVVRYASTLAIVLSVFHFFLGIDCLIQRSAEDGGIVPWTWLLHELLLAGYMVLVPVTIRVVANRCLKCNEPTGDDQEVDELER